VARWRAFFCAIRINQTIVPEGKMEERLTQKGRFDSWKEISLYLNRTIRTCYRWRKDLGLPVYRVDRMSKRSRVFAYKNEIDQWFNRKSGPQVRRTRPGRRKDGVGREKRFGFSLWRIEEHREEQRPAK
jgi:hypothetical protein